MIQIFASVKIVPGHLIAQADLVGHDYTREQYNLLNKKKMTKLHMILSATMLSNEMTNDIYYVVVMK